MSEGITKWEYQIYSLGSILKSPKDEELVELLNEWGENGWELVLAVRGESTNRRVVRQVECHQRCERGPRGQCIQDTLSIGQRLFRGGHRRFQVRHNDCTSKLPGCMRKYVAQGCLVPNMQMPVIRAGQGDFLLY